MRISLACNWKLDMLRMIEDDPLIKSNVYDLYGTHDMGFTGSGRPFFLLPKMQKENIEEYINKLHDMGIKFTWLWNGECLGFHKFNREDQSYALKELDWLDDLGVEFLTVTDPYLAEFAKTHHPSLKLKVSVISEANSATRAKEWEKIVGKEGVLTLSIMTNRNFTLLEEIRKVVKCDIELLTNDCCLNECPFRFFHYNECAHASQRYDVLRGYYYDWSTMACQNQKAFNPEQIIMCKWIQPNDLKRYMKIGIDYFKISGRRFGTPWLFNVLKSYSSQEYDNNLGEIFNGYSFVSDPLQLADPQFSEFSARQANTGSDADDVSVILSVPDFKPRLHAGNLSEFLENLPHKGAKCAESCGLTCTYCYQFVEKAYHIDNEENVNSYKKFMKYLIDYIHYGDMFLPEKEQKLERPMKASKTFSLTGINWEQEARQFLEDTLIIIPEEMKRAAEMGMRFIVERTAETQNKSNVELELLISVIAHMVPKPFKHDFHDFLIEKGKPPANYYSKDELDEIKKLPYGTPLMAEKSGQEVPMQEKVSQKQESKFEIRSKAEWEAYLEKFIKEFNILVKPHLVNLPTPMLFQYKISDHPEMDYWQLITSEDVQWGIGQSTQIDKFPTIIHKTDFDTIKKVNSGETDPVQATMAGSYVVEGDTAKLMACAPILPLNAQAHANVLKSEKLIIKKRI